MESPYIWKASKERKDTFLIINNAKELHLHLEKEDVTEIIPNTPNFVENTLLVGNVMTTSGIHKIKTSVIKQNDKDSTLIISVWTNLTNITDNRIISILIPKLGNYTKVFKQVTIEQYKE